MASSVATDLGYLISKGGITTQTLLADGLGLEAVQLEGQLLPGLSVVRAIASSVDIAQQCPQLPVITFPGNLGTEETLKDAWLLFEGEN